MDVVAWFDAMEGYHERGIIIIVIINIIIPRAWYHEYDKLLIFIILLSSFDNMCACVNA